MNIPNLTGEAAKVQQFNQSLERVSILAEQLVDELRTTRETYRGITSPQKRSSYERMVDELLRQIMLMHIDSDRFFSGESVVGEISRVFRSRIAHNMIRPGVVWDPDITENVCALLPHLPSDELHTNPDFLRAVAGISPNHPLRAGPGSWHAIHVIGRAVKTYDEHVWACGLINTLADYFYCLRCKDHFRTYLKTHDPRDLVPTPTANVFKELIPVDPVTNRDLPPVRVSKLFLWTVDFHNEVNRHRTDFSGEKTAVVVDALEANLIYDDFLNETFQPCPSCSRD